MEKAEFLVRGLGQRMSCENEEITVYKRTLELLRTL